MKRLLLLAMVLCIGAASMAQSEKTAGSRDAKAKSKEVKKKMEANLDSIASEKAFQALKDQDFVVEGERVIFKRGTTVIVNPTTNFVSLKGEKAVIQIAPLEGFAGENGVGGVTVDGKASNIRIKTSKKGRTTFSMNVTGTSVSATVDITIMKGSDKASVSISPNFNSNRLTLEGRLMPTAHSSIFKGNTAF